GRTPPDRGRARGAGGAAAEGASGPRDAAAAPADRGVAARYGALDGRLALPVPGAPLGPPLPPARGRRHAAPRRAAAPSPLPPRPGRRRQDAAARRWVHAPRGVGGEPRDAPLRRHLGGERLRRRGDPLHGAPREPRGEPGAPPSDGLARAGAPRQPRGARPGPDR